MSRIPTYKLQVSMMDISMETDHVVIGMNCAYNQLLSFSDLYGNTYDKYYFTGGM